MSALRRPVSVHSLIPPPSLRRLDSVRNSLAFHPAVRSFSVFPPGAHCYPSSPPLSHRTVPSLTSAAVNRLSLVHRHLSRPSIPILQTMNPVASFATAPIPGTDAEGSSNPAAAASLPLAGIRVLDMTRVLAGPYCTQILGDMGAEIIKIEHPVRGDDTRAWGPPYAPYVDPEGREPGESAYFLCANRNKKSVALSYADADGVAILHELIRQSDVLVENYLPGTLGKYGLDYATVAEINPRLIYASVTGYGQTGPYSHRAGYDVMVEAEFGLMHITGARDGPAVKVGVAVTDLTTGLYTSNAIMAALLGRSVSGKGVHIDVSLSDCQTATLANIASSVLISNKPDSGRWGTAHPSIVPYESFPTADGSVLLGAGNDRLFGVLSNGLGRSDWPTDERYATNASRVKHRAELVQKIGDISKQHTTQHWMDLFSNSGLPCAPINDVKTALELEHTKARNMIRTLDHPRCGPIKVVNTPIKMTRMSKEVQPLTGDGMSYFPSPPASPSSDETMSLKRDQEPIHSRAKSQPVYPTASAAAGATPTQRIRTVEKPIDAPLGPRSPPPLLGQHTHEVLAGLVGLRGDQISDLATRGVVFVGKEV